GEWICEFSEPDLPSYLNRHGEIPLPHYILKQRPTNQSDRATNQTVYAQTPGSIAAPTAGLHFTTELLDKIQDKGVSIATLTLHIGWGTFKPIFSEDISRHKMLPEYFELTDDCCQKITEARKKGGRVIAVGTSATRTLETVGDSLQPQKGWANLFIYPGHKFKELDCLITNFHLPKSTPLLLACAFATREKLLNAYKEAIQRKYRFYSYGDAMLIL
ncbi:MAG: S-adenosylmethionine:tRNA ribosyltransferase-isomerase, partial [Elusimicrobia bacterium]|nr:S-adenosylmethionine:tRNA ribosyltransferase-isomerase [Elusimicrobiota bacterium]